MKFQLICDRNPKDLGIIDENGHFDMDKFQQHVENCETCLKLMESFVSFMGHFKEDHGACKAKG